MERLKALCRILIVVALTIFTISFFPGYFTPDISESQAYEQFLLQVQNIQTSLQLTETDSALISEEEFHKSINVEEVKQRFLSELDNTKLTSVYGEETIGEVTEQVGALYENQQALCEDAVYSKYIRQMRIYSGFVIVCSSIIMFLLVRIKKVKSQSVIKNSQYEDDR